MIACHEPQIMISNILCSWGLFGKIINICLLIEIYISQMFLPNINFKISANSNSFCKYSNWRADWKDTLREPRPKPKSFSSLNQTILSCKFQHAVLQRQFRVNILKNNQKQKRKISLNAFRLCNKSILFFLHFKHFKNRYKS